MKERMPHFWSVSPDEMLHVLKTTKHGLSNGEADARLDLYGANILKPQKRSDARTLLARQFKSPIILILFFATGLSFYLGDISDAFVILAIVLASGLLGFWQELGAANAVARLLSIVQISASVIRDDSIGEIPVEHVVPGDIVMLKAGDVIPADCLILESKDLFVDESTLTGETFPVEKETAILPSGTEIEKRTNSLWMATHVISGTARALAVRTGRETEFGKVSERLKLAPMETEFERGIRRFGYFLMEVTLTLIVIIFAVNVYLSRPVLDSFLFSLALAVGLTPQLLPAIISINLAHGAKRMAQMKVIVKRLASIENFGSMNVICSDKTGTLTEGTVCLRSAVGIDGNPSDKVILYAYLNAFYETGFINPIDEAIRTYKPLDISDWHKMDEIPYDFVRKMLSILVSRGETNLMVSKGALLNILEACSTAETETGKIVPISEMKDRIQQDFENFSKIGLRTLGVAFKNTKDARRIATSDETEMTFAGFLVFHDPLKSDIVSTTGRLKSLGVTLKIITGDNRLVAAHVSGQIGMEDSKMLTGAELHQMSDTSLIHQVMDVNIFAEIEPNQKERIIIALRKAGNVVGYMGDGVNDASALHSADVGISVDSAVDVAKDAADIVLLEKDLGVLVNGVREGRATFANTLKYVFMATSANFGNMFSMAGASIFLSFLPLLPKQILLTNLLTDVPEMTIATDGVDDEMTAYPRRWDIRAIRKFMITFGFVSSAIDYITFAVLLFILRANSAQFRTGWFIESVISAALIVLVIRTRKPFFRSKPGKLLLAATLGIIALTLVVPFSPIAVLFGFTPLPLYYLAFILVVMAVYVMVTEAVKKVFYKKVKL